MDLPPDLLIRVGAQLPFAERLRLSLVCRHWCQVCSGPSALWGFVEAQIDVPDEATEPEDEEHELELEGLVFTATQDKLDAFRKWLAPRAAAVAELNCQLQVHNQGAADSLDLQLPSRLLPPCFDLTCMPALQHMTVRFRGGAKLSFVPCPEMPALRTLSLANMRLSVGDVQPHQFGCFANTQGLEFAMYHGELSDDLVPLGVQEVAHAWLPPCTTKLRLLNVGLREVPGVVAHLPHLRSLELDANGPLESTSLTRLSALGTLRQRLQQLDLGMNFLPRFPAEVSVLTSLRILFLYQNFTSSSVADWEALRPLSKLVFLSISSNGLRELPPAVAAMSHLRGLHIEDNPLARRLAPHPCFHNLLELLLDWKDALSAYDTLRACTHLTRLTLTNHAVYGTTAAGSVPLPALFGDRLLEALAAMPSLRLIEDVVDPSSLDLLVPAVARCMWQLGRACPHVRLEQITSTFIGWSLGKMPPEVEAEVAASEAAAAGSPDRGLPAVQPHSDA